MLPSLDRVYVSERARADLGWRPTHEFSSVITRAVETGDIRSGLAKTTGAKGYHA